MTAESEYFIPKLLRGERDVPSILVDADTLLELLLRADPMMSATDRRRYNDRAIQQIQEVIAQFTLAYDFPDDRLEHLKKMWAAITNFIHTMRIIGMTNAICIQPKYEKMTPHQMKIELVNRIASLDEGAEKWRKSVLKAQRTKGATPTKG